MAIKKEIVLYIIGNSVTDKVYIGVCSWYVQRISKHFSDLRDNKHANKYLQKDYDAYGKDSFYVDILEKYEKKFDAFTAEKYLIGCVYGKNKNYCYNILSGGIDAAKGMRERWRNMYNSSQEVRDQFAKSMIGKTKGRKMSQDQKQKLSIARIGTKISEKTRRKFSEQRIGGGNARAKKVINIITGEVFDCLKDAAKSISVQYDNVRSQVNRSGRRINKTNLEWL